MLQPADAALENPDFVAHVSHQILSCAAKAQAIAGILDSDLFSEELQPKLSQTLSLLVRDLERLGHKLIYLQKSPESEMLSTGEIVDLVGLIDETANPFQWQYPHHPLVKRYLSDFPPIRANKEHIQIILDNLLSNAFKYSPPQTAVTITAEAYLGLLEKHSGKVVISVTNLGSFIPFEEREKIFKKFYRGDIPGQPGQGLGLYLSRRLVHQYGGQLEVESSPSEGTTFWFTLPLVGSPKTNGFSYGS
jgi:signal transduction histidine kinase